MNDAIRAFLLYLQLERGGSEETHRNYQSDLQQFLAHIQAQFFQANADPQAKIGVDGLGWKAMWRQRPAAA